VNIWQPIRDRIFPPDISIFHAFQKPPYGGANQFLMALRDQISRRGIRVGENHIASATRACILNAFAFDTEHLRRQKRSECRVLHRIDGPVGTYRGTDHAVDKQVADLNAEFADVTVFQSQYSCDANQALGLEFKNVVIIPNASDSRIFYPKTIPFNKNKKVKLIASSWSDNPNKGGPVYEWLDSHLDWSRFEFTFVGQTKRPFRNIRHLQAVPSHELAHLLRQHDIYITASLHDSCSNALIEALSCGLPSLYAESGGNPEIVQQAGFGFSDKEEIPECLNLLVEEYETCQNQISVATLESVTDQYLRAVGIT
jgi:glycosyltransferase involved in cell wall biosynthesis